MGWSGVPRGWADNSEDVIRDQIETGGKNRIIAKSGRYLAVEKVETGEVHAVVALVHVGADEISTKLIDEGMGPVHANCPTHILNLLTEPAPNQHAQDWRERCRRNAEAKAQMPKLRPGDTIRLNQPIRFVGGFEADTFIFERRYSFHTPDGRYVRLNKDWKQRYQWEIVQHAPAR